MRIGGLDSGKRRDSTCLVGSQVRKDPVDRRNKLYIVGARFWHRKLYLQMEDDVAHIHQKHPFNIFPVEVNHVGEHVYEVLKYVKHMPVLPIYTGKDLKDIKKIQGYKTMDKNAMTNMMVAWKADGLIVFPPKEKRSADMNEVVRQFTVFVEHRTEAGNISYYAEGEEHDDGVMATMLNCFMARKLIGDASYVPAVYNRKFEHGEKDVLGSAVADRPGVRVTSRSVYYP